MKFEFEEIGEQCWRAKVLGGWLVKAYEDVVHEREGGLLPGWDYRVSMTFVPDPKHEWEVSNKKSK